jgi:CRP/FNR family transcriptional regulator, cyclic AMP receptor protein
MESVPEPALVPPSAADLRNIGLFGALSDETLQELASSLELRTPAAGEFIFQEGGEARELYVILRGEVEVIRKTPQGTELRLARFMSGRWFGEASVLDVGRRSASARAVVPSRILVLSCRDLDALYRRDIKAYTLLVLNMARELARRLRRIDDVLAGFLGNLSDHHLGHG